MLYKIQKEYNKKLYKQIDKLVGDLGIQLRDEYKVSCDVLQAYMRVLQSKLEDFAYCIVRREVYEGMKEYFQHMDDFEIYNHDHIPLTDEIMYLNGYEYDEEESGNLDVYFHVQNGVYICFVDGKCNSVHIKTDDGYLQEAFGISTVADFENLLELLGIDKQVKIK